MNELVTALGGLSVIIVLILVIQAILWFLVPFYIFGMSGRLKNIEEWIISIGKNVDRIDDRQENKKS